MEVFGSADPAVDAEVIILAMDFYQRLGLQNLQLVLNSVGCPECRPGPQKASPGIFASATWAASVPPATGRFDRNPLRIFDCKSDSLPGAMLREAPTITDALCR
ncbi:MAG: hypothetical protein ACOX37_12215 [Bacillota bacterium]